MKRAENQSITRFIDGEWYIDIVETKSKFEAWIQHKNYGVSDLMFSVPKKQKIGRKIYKTDFEDFYELVNSQDISYMRAYIKAHMEDAEDIL